MNTSRNLHLLFTLVFLICIYGIAGAQDLPVPDSPEIFILGEKDFDVDQINLSQNQGLVNSVSDDLKLTLEDVHFTDGLMSFTLSFETSEAAGGHAASSNTLFLNGKWTAGGAGNGIEPGPFVNTETYAWYNTPAAKEMDWESFHVTFGDVFFTIGDGVNSVYIAPAENYDWSFVFHNPETSAYNADGFAPTVDEKGIHTFGSSFDISLGGSLFSKGPYGEDDDIYSFNIITKSDLLNTYGSQEGMWYNGVHRMGGGGSIEFDGEGNPVLPEDGKFTQYDHFTYQVPQAFSASENSLAVWANSVTFEIACTGPNVDPVMGYTWKWDSGFEDREGNSVYPKKLVQFNHVTDRLPQPEDPALFSETVSDVTVDIVSLDLIDVPNSRLYGNQTDTGKTKYFQTGFCATAVDDGEWMVLPEQMTVGNEIIWASTFVRGGMVPASSETPGKMCGYLRYDITNLDPDWDAPVTLGITEMSAIPREGSPCKDIMHRYETNSAAQALGFTLSCEDNADSDVVRGPKDYILKVESFDSSRWTAEEALEAVEKLLDFNISGPWTFRIEHMDEIICK